MFCFHTLRTTEEGLHVTKMAASMATVIPEVAGVALNTSFLDQCLQPVRLEPFEGHNQMSCMSHIHITTHVSRNYSYEVSMREF